jgi:hypothetical protein
MSEITGRQIVRDDGPSGLGQEDLAAGTGLAQARGQVHAEAVVPLLGLARLPRVQRHPRPHDRVAGPDVAGRGHRCYRPGSEVAG